MSGWSNYSGIVTNQKMNENEMGYRGSKSIADLNTPQVKNKSVVVKEQRVDGSYTNNLVLRCTLMGLERDFQVKTLSKIYNNKFNSIRHYSTNVHTISIENTIISPWFITGFFDGEGCFSVYLRNKSKGSTYCEARISISLHKKDLETLKCIKAYFNGKGSIVKHGEDSLQYVITSIDQLSTLVIPHFDNYPLISKKYADYLLFKKAVHLIRNKEHLSIEGLQEIVSIKTNMNKGLSEELKRAFPNNIGVARPLVPDYIIPDPQWIAGFTSGEGSFMIKLSQSPASKLGFGVQLIFQITQNNRDEALMKRILTYFGCGRLVKDGTKIVYIVTKFSSIIDIIIPFFDNHHIVGIKLQDYLDWCKGADIIKTRNHLTESGLNELQKIKAGMNRARAPR
jgi:hypothetical protein